MSTDQTPEPTETPPERFDDVIRRRAGRPARRQAATAAQTAVAGETTSGLSFPVDGNVHARPLTADDVVRKVAAQRRDRRGQFFDINERKA